MLKAGDSEEEVVYEGVEHLLVCWEFVLFIYFVTSSQRRLFTLAITLKTGEEGQYSHTVLTAAGIAEPTTFSAIFFPTTL